MERTNEYSEGRKTRETRDLCWVLRPNANHRNANRWEECGVARRGKARVVSMIGSECNRLCGKKKIPKKRAVPNRSSLCVALVACQRERENFFSSVLLFKRKRQILRSCLHGTNNDRIKMLCLRWCTLHHRDIYDAGYWYHTLLFCFLMI